MRPSPRSRPGTFCTLGGWLCGRPQRKVGKEAVREPLQARANQKVVDLVGDSPDHLANALVDGHALRSDGVRLPKGLAILVQSILEFGRRAFGSDNNFFSGEGGNGVASHLGHGGPHAPRIDDGDCDGAAFQLELNPDGAGIGVQRSLRAETGREAVVAMAGDGRVSGGEGGRPAGESCPSGPTFAAQYPDLKGTGIFPATEEMNTMWPSAS